jgi:hypothetical protein
LLFHHQNGITRTNIGLNFQLVIAHTYSPIFYGFTYSLSVLASHCFSFILLWKKLDVATVYTIECLHCEEFVILTYIYIYTLNTRENKIYSIHCSLPLRHHWQNYETSAKYQGECQFDLFCPSVRARRIQNSSYLEMCGTVFF